MVDVNVMRKGKFLPDPWIDICAIQINKHYQIFVFYLFLTRKRFQIRACLISARKAKHLDATIMFTYSHANTPLGQSERAHYLSYFINWDGKLLIHRTNFYEQKDFAKNDLHTP